MQVLLNGIVSGCVIAVLALSFAVVYLPTRVFHFALGGVHTFIPFVVWALVSRGAGWPLAVAVAACVGVVLSSACEFLNHAPLARANASVSVHLLSSLALYTIISQAAALIWGNDPKTLRTSEDVAVSLKGLVLTQSQLIEFLTALVVLIVAAWCLKKTNLGLQFRGLADNPRQLMLLGYDVWRLRLFAFGLSGLLCVGSAVPLALDYGFDPNSGLNTLLLAVVAVIIGGRGSFVGPVLGGLVLGIVRSEVIWTFSGNWQEAATFVLLGLVLLFRPAGLFGTLARLEARE